jgi:cysteine desulfuration protein SufE
MAPNSLMTTLDDIRADFELLDTWEDRFRYVMELGRALPAYPEALRNEAHKVRGCASQVWLASHVDRTSALPVMTFDGDSDSQLVRGLVAVLFVLYQGRPAGEIVRLDAHGLLKDLGLEQALTPQRSNGLASMVTRIREDAARVLSAT